MNGADLLDIADLLDAVGDPVGSEVAFGIRAYLSGEYCTLDEAIGIRPAPGQRSIVGEFRRAQRDHHIRAAADRFGLDAVALARRLDRFYSTAWPNCSTEPDVPDRFVGRLEEHLFLALRAWPRPVGERHIRNILRN